MFVYFSVLFFFSLWLVVCIWMWIIILIMNVLTDECGEVNKLLFEHCVTIRIKVHECEKI